MIRRVVKIFLGVFLFCFVDVAQTIETPNKNENISIAGIEIPSKHLFEMVKQTSQWINNVTESKRSRIKRSIISCNEERGKLGIQRDMGLLGKVEYEQKLLGINETIKQFEKELETFNNRADNIQSNVENLIFGGANKGLEFFFKQKEEEQKRKTQIADTAVRTHIENEGTLKRLQHMTDSSVMKRTGLLLSLTAVGTYGGYRLIKLLYAYFESKFGRPSLVLESSRSGWWDTLKKYFFEEELGLNLFDDVILPKKIETKLVSLAKDTKNSMITGLPFRHVLLHGPPGTGKTMFARKLAQYAEMDYAIVPGANFAQFKEGQDVAELNKLFDWADKGKKGLIVFVDEADAFLRSRKILNDRGIKLVNAFLSRTGSSSDKCMFIFATNNPEDLDTAVLSRVHKKIYFPLPDLEERIKILNLYLDRCVRNDESRTTIHGEIKKEGVKIAVAEDVNEEFIDIIAQKTGGFSGRGISQMIDELRARCYADINFTLTQALFNEVVEEKIEEALQEKDMEKSYTKNKEVDN
jgi:AAA+ superfamily predicted ATPase